MRLLNLLSIGCLLCVSELFRSAGGGMMHHMMKHMMQKKHHDHHDKGIKITFKPVHVPIPVAYMEEKPTEKPWPSASHPHHHMKDMVMKMMHMKMKMKMKMMKGMHEMVKAKHHKKCCHQKQKGCCNEEPSNMKAAWPMAMPVMCPPMMMGWPMMPMMKGCDMPMMKGCDMPMSNCPMMKGGWPPMKGGWPPMKGGWPPMKPCEDEVDEEDPEEVQGWPEYYEQEMGDDQNAWDTNLVPVYVKINGGSNTKQRRGDDLDQTPKKKTLVKVLSQHNLLYGSVNSLGYDFDYF